MLFLDLEVYSEVDITSNPIDVYANHPSTKIIVACTAIDNGPILTMEDRVNGLTPLRILHAYRGQLNAWNVGFERTVLAAKGFPTPIERWTDTMVLARYLGLPGSLKQCCKVLQLPEEIATKSEKALIKKFCMPLTGKMKPGTPEEWEQFKVYCQHDVASQRAIYNKLTVEYEFPESEVRRVWLLDQVINERGLPIDIVTSAHAASEVERLQGEAKSKLTALTGLANPNSVQQLLPWVKERGYIHDSLGKEYVQQAIDREGDRLTNECREVLSVRLSAAKSSVKKFAAIVEGTSPDNRLRHQFKYYGAHTGRWSGRDVQPQNLTRTAPDAQELADLCALMPGGELDSLSFCVRPMILAGPGKKLLIADLASIEPRALAWLSGCDPMTEVFKKDLDLYKDFGTRFYRLGYDDITKKQRQICKPAVLGCGYGLGPGQEKEMASGMIEFTGLRGYAEGYGVVLSAQESRDMVNLFRNSYYEVVEYWRYLERAFHAAVKTGKRQQVGVVYFGTVQSKTNEVEAVYIELPSKRRIHYMNPRAWQGAKGIEIRFDGLRKGQWWSCTTWGGSLCENVVQAVARDVLVEGMMRAEADNMPIVGHCHDELIAEVPEKFVAGVDRMCAAMSSDIEWAPGLLLGAEGWEGRRYGKG